MTQAAADTDVDLEKALGSTTATEPSGGQDNGIVDTTAAAKHALETADGVADGTRTSEARESVPLDSTDYFYNCPSTPQALKEMIKDREIHVMARRDLFDGGTLGRAFNKFDYLCRVRLLHLEYDLAMLQSELEAADGALGNDLRTRLDHLLNQYYSALRDYRFTGDFDRMDPVQSILHGRHMARRLQGPGYQEPWYRNGMISLKRQSKVADRVRIILQKGMPVRLLMIEALDSRWQERYYIDDIRMVRFRRFQIPSMVDWMASVVVAVLGGPTNIMGRVIVSLIGGTSLLVPMIIQTYVTGRHWEVVITVLFVLTFAIMVALLTEAKNQELLGATAAYAAVLVVFVGTSLQKPS